MGEPRTPASEPSRPAGRIAGYEIHEKVGQGGMGVVFRARQVSLDRTVALKTLPPRLTADPKFVERFLREARATAKLNHPHIVRIYDVGRSPNGIYYFSMEYLPGGTVRDVMEREGKIDPRRALAWVRQMAEALVHASRAGIVHRDIKPDNIMITEGGEAKLADLGVAGPARSTGQTDRITGTPYYMAPEQVEGNPVDVRADLYSLGATWFHMVTGRPPFVAENTLGVLTQHVTEEAPDPREIDSSVSEGDADLILQLLEKNPADRFQTPEDLLEAIDGLGRPRRRRVPISLDREDLRGGMRMAAWGAAALVAVALVVAVLQVVGHRSREREANRLYDLADDRRAAIPPDFAGAIEVLDDLLVRYPGTRAAERARREIPALREALDRRRDEPEGGGSRTQGPTRAERAAAELARLWGGLRNTLTDADRCREAERVLLAFLDRYAGTPSESTARAYLETVREKQVGYTRDSELHLLGVRVDEILRDLVEGRTTAGTAWTSLHGIAESAAGTEVARRASGEAERIRNEVESEVERLVAEAFDRLETAGLEAAEAHLDSVADGRGFDDLAAQVADAGGELKERMLSLYDQEIGLLLPAVGETVLMLHRWDGTGRPDRTIAEGVARLDRVRLRHVRLRAWQTAHRSVLEGFPPFWESLDRGLRRDPVRTVDAEGVPIRVDGIGADGIRIGEIDGRTVRRQLGWDALGERGLRAIVRAAGERPEIEVAFWAGFLVELWGDPAAARGMMKRAWQDTPGVGPEDLFWRAAFLHDNLEFQR